MNEFINKLNKLRFNIEQLMENSSIKDNRKREIFKKSKMFDISKISESTKKLGSKLSTFTSVKPKDIKNPLDTAKEMSEWAENNKSVAGLVESIIIAVPFIINSKRKDPDKVSTSGVSLFMLIAIAYFILTLIGLSKLGVEKTFDYIADIFKHFLKAATDFFASLLSLNPLEISTRFCSMVSEFFSMTQRAMENFSMFISQIIPGFNSIHMFISYFVTLSISAFS